MQRLDGEIWLTVDDLTDVGIKEATLWNGILRNSPRWQAIPDPADRRRRLVRYATLAGKYQERVKAALCGGLEPGEWLVMKKEEARAVELLGTRDSLLDKVEEICEEGYKKYLHLYRGVGGGGRMSPSQQRLQVRQQRCLARAAGILDTLAEWYRREEPDWRSYQPVNEVAAWVAAHRDEYFEKKYLTTAPTRLKTMLRAYALKGHALDSVVTMPRSGNDNRATRKREMWWQAAALHLRTDGRNLSQSAIVRKIKDLALILVKEAPSESTVRGLLQDTALLTAGKHLDHTNRHGHRHRSSMPIADTMFGDDCWEMDATRVQLAPHLTKDADGKKKLEFLTVTVVRDVYSGAYLGWHLSHAESGHSYRMALKMAVDLTGRLPYELRHDRFPGHNTPEWEHLFGLLGRNVKLTKTSTASGKARAERAFYTLQQVFESEHLAYWGQGIRDTTARAHPTEAHRLKASKELRNSGWDFDAAWMAECGVLAAYNHTPLSKYSRKHKALDQSPWQLYENSEADSRGHRPDALEVMDMFWATRQEGVRNRCIKMTVNKKTHRYDLLGEEHYEILNRYQRAGATLTVRYEPHDLSRIMLFDKAGNWLGEVAKQGNVQLTGPDAQWGEAAKWKQKNAALNERIEGDLANYLAQFPAEAAAMLPTKVSKAVSEDAQTRYLLDNAAEWQREAQRDKGTKAQSAKVAPPVDVEETEFDVRSTY